MRLAAMVVAVGIMAGVTGGCAWSIGSDRKSDARPTKGQELVDLKKALDQGAISEEEYQAQKQRLLSK
jgi:hypothetical protein